MTGLDEIDLSHNCLTEIPDSLQGLHIEFLFDLSFNKIEVVRASLGKFNCVEDCLNLEGNPITEVEDAKAARSMCTPATIK